jgi:hypothetical protein
MRKTSGSFLMNFQADFGREVAQSFTVGFHLGNNEVYAPSNQISVYPNPSQDKFNISLGLVIEQDVNLILMDLNGREISRKSYSDIKNQTLRLNLDNYPKGLYVLRIELKDEVIIKKIVLQ